MTDSKVLLHQIDKANLYREIITVEGSVAGKDTSPYLPPKEVKLLCKTYGGGKLAICENCKLSPSLETAIAVSKEDVVDFVGISNSQIKSSFKRQLKIPFKCRIGMLVKKTYRVEDLVVIPPLSYNFSSSNETGPHIYVTKRILYVGDEIGENKSYTFRGLPSKIPLTQKAVFLAVAKKAHKDSLETFRLKVSQAKELRRHLTDASSLEILHEHLSINVTKIYGRPLLHRMVNLVYHSPLHFYFNGDYIHRGYLNTLILGDTRCGKGFVAERLARYYNLGEICSGENSSFVGLVGGIKQVDGNNYLTWGKLPHNNRGLVIIDELSDLSTDSIGKMSRIRSEGIAELDKGGIHSHTEARTRLICISNPRDGLNLDDFRFGIEAIVKLIGRAEDISRFDAVLCVSRDEVSPEIINAPLIPKVSTHFTSEFCRSLILWIWSRRANQIIFSKEATARILRESLEFGRTYSSQIPLIMANDIRVKLARLACAFAGSLFRTDKEYKFLRVDLECVELAVNFLEKVYRKDACRYYHYSQLRVQVEGEDMDNASIMKIISRLPEGGGLYILKSAQVTVKGMMDACKMRRDPTKKVIQALCKAKALEKRHSFWRKKRTFVKFLEEKIL